MRGPPKGILGLRFLITPAVEYPQLNPLGLHLGQVIATPEAHKLSGTGLPQSL